MAGPNNITRAIIDATVDRGLREIEEDPQRSIRKLADMGKQFTKGRFLQEVYEIIQELLRDDNCPYYTAIENLLRHTERKTLKHFGINVGYNSMTYGGKIIRTKEEENDFLIPWVLMFRLNNQIAGSMSAAELNVCVQEGQKLGIFTYGFRCLGTMSELDKLTPIFNNYKNCAFFCMLPDQPLTPAHLAQIKTCSNVLFTFDASGSSSSENVAAMRKQKSLYGVYDIYSDQNKAEWLNGNTAKKFSDFACSFAFMIADDLCSEETQQEIFEHIKNTRIRADYPFVAFDYYLDSKEIDQIMSSNACYLEILENGDLHTQNGLITDFRHTTSLEQLLSIGLPHKK